MAYVKKRSVLPIYFVGGAWLLWALCAPLYRPTHYLMAALASLAAYFVGKMIFPDRGYEMADVSGPAQPKPREEKPQSTGNPEIDALLDERAKAVSEMRRLNDSIKDVKISAQISHLESTTAKIIDAVVEKPAKLPQIRKFMNYYLPTTLKLLKSYDMLENQSYQGENIVASRRKIESVLDMLIAAYEKQLDRLFGNDALDIATDIDVLETMMAGDGLTEKGQLRMG